ncbi:MAG: DNA topoisomerase VI subunit B [Planctomycetota bacterium]|nr:DNA topoisomerase VI subunit B [Planctomycetota bacterium]
MAVRKARGAKRKKVTKRKPAKRATRKKPAARKKSATRKKPATRRTKATAESMAKRQREISVSEFFAKNRHLLGFDNPRKALLTTIKEAVDNSIDACEEAEILPDLLVEITPVEGEDERFVVAVEDNGPGIVKAQVGKIFGKLLYGSKFHSMKQSRGQQGIGISAAGMYGQLTTGKPMRITTRPSKSGKALRMEVRIDTARNRPEVMREREAKTFRKGSGTRVEIQLEGRYLKGKQSVDEYLQQTAMANPHVSITYQGPGEDEPVVFKRASQRIPDPAREIKPHPHGVELGVLARLLKGSPARTVKGALQDAFSRVSSAVAGAICDAAGVSPKARPGAIANREADLLYKAIRKTRIMSPATDCVVPIGQELVLEGLKKEVDADLFTAVTRPPAVYRGNPFVVEAGIAWGGNLPADDLARVIRFANRVPLLYQPGACAISKSIVGTTWKNYGLQQSRGALPVGPLVIFVHVASVWVPFTSESKEAVAHYPEIVKEIRLALNECGRKLGAFLSRRRREADEAKKVDYISKYLPQIGIALQEILELSDMQTTRAVNKLEDVLERSRKH